MKNTKHHMNTIIQKDFLQEVTNEELINLYKSFVSSIVIISKEFVNRNNNNKLTQYDLQRIIKINQDGTVFNPIKYQSTP